MLSFYITNFEFQAQVWRFLKGHMLQNIPHVVICRKLCIQFVLCMNYPIMNLKKYSIFIQSHIGFYSI